MEALEYYEKQTLCTCGCGLPRDIAHDRKQVFKVDVVKCQARRALYIAQRDNEQLALPVRDRKKGWMQGVTQPDEEHHWLLWSAMPFDPNTVEVANDDPT